MPALEILPWHSPITAFRKLAGKPWAHLFHGGEKSETARWSFIVARPSGTVTLQKGQVRRDTLPVRTGLISALRQLKNDFDTNDSKLTHDPAAPPFQYGLAGFIGYEAAVCFEPSLNLPPSPFRLPDVAMGYYEAVAAFDRRLKRIVVTGVSPRAVQGLIDQLALDDDCVEAVSARKLKAITRCNFTRKEFIETVEATRAAILAGDIFQANIARQITLDLYSEQPADEKLAFDVFHQMTQQADADHAALLQFSGATILSNSPERFFNVTPVNADQFDILVEPIKGTIARGETPEDDAALKTQLQESEKDRAENVMITDLLRNDLSRVCTPQSVREKDICSVLSLTYVHHLVSRVCGTLRPGLNALDALAALFPCGSITGAPKIEAMKTIASLEKVGRGPYCGAIGYIDANGAADFSVSIRTMMIERGKTIQRCTIPVGGGITLMSHAQIEYEETVLKAIGLTTGLSTIVGPLGVEDTPS